mmetsp:Transcript_85742/g.237569  ORF Transcript_85742/g.237569 Transcript_85742/m.237569 type:complete len:120 (+) Transcript_85742:58-417(+)
MLARLADAGLLAGPFIHSQADAGCDLVSNSGALPLLSPITTHHPNACAVASFLAFNDFGKRRWWHEVRDGYEVDLLTLPKKLAAVMKLAVSLLKGGGGAVKSGLANASAASAHALQSPQ